MTLVNLKHMENGEWVDDGTFTEEEVKLFVFRCEYDQHGIEYQIEKVKEKPVKTRKEDVDATTDADDEQQ